VTILRLCLVTLLLAGCRDQGLTDGRGETGFRDIGPAGGEVRWAGARLTIPAGALTETVRVTLGSAGEPAAGALNRPVEVGPPGLTLALPATLEHSFSIGGLIDPALPGLARVAGWDGSHWRPLEPGTLDVGGARVAGTIAGAGRFALVQICGNVRACPIGQICAGVTCVPQEDCVGGGDEDGDGAVDCRDSDCAQDPRCATACCFDPAASTCVASCCDDKGCSGTCRCAPEWCSRCAQGGGELCETPGDEDGDGYADCRDPDCGGVAPCGPEPAEICNDGADNDLDGALDCADPDCVSDPLACPACCVDTAAGACVPACAGGADGSIACACGPERCGPCGAAPEGCTGGADEDGDGQIDCADADCALHSACQAAEHCTNGLDDDGDGQIDCADKDCDQHDFCGPCRGARMEMCSDRQDNDCDGAVDCADPDCDQHAACTSCCVDAEGACVASCEGRTGCSCAPSLCWRCGDAQPESNCFDGRDENGNGLIDCRDPGCAGERACAPCVEAPETCDNARDDDCDGLIDCADDGCAGAPPCNRSRETCGDGQDNDGDRRVDCRDPLDCGLVPACRP
jgi:hypothetical protein